MNELEKLILSRANSEMLAATLGMSKLLVDKGVCTKEELMQAVLDAGQSDVMKKVTDSA